MTAFFIKAGALAGRFWTSAAGLACDMRWSYVPPLMVYFAAGVSAFTGIIEAFFVKEKLGLSAAMLVLRSWMSRRPVPYLVVFLSLFGTVMTLPFLGMFYGLHEWTAAHFGFGARTIALIDTMADSPLGQVAMIPMLAWIAKEAPRRQKATYFAVMAAFTNLALSASQLGTKYLNRLFVVERGRYDELGLLMIVTIAIGLVLPLLAVWVFQLRPNGRYRNLGASFKLIKS